VNDVKTKKVVRTKGRAPLQPGDRIRLTIGFIRFVGQVLADLGPRGLDGRQRVRIRIHPVEEVTRDQVEELDWPADWIRVVRRARKPLTSRRASRSRTR
jgi:hypothetical protein